MLKPRPSHKFLAILQIVLLTAGCVSVRTTGHHPSSSKDVGGVEVKVFADDDARKSGALGPRFVVGELERAEGKRWEPVFKSLAPAWSVVNLPPGKYRLRVPALLDPEGNAVTIDNEGKVFRVRKGEVSEVEVTLRHRPTGLIVAGAVAAVVAAVVLADWLGDHDLPIPTPPSFIAEDIFELTVDMAFIAAHGPEVEGDDDERPPVVTSHFPEDGALVAARRVRVIFASSEPLHPNDLDRDAITVLAEKAGLVPGHLTYDPENWWVIWQPDGELPRGDILHVTLKAGSVEDLSGNDLGRMESFSFKTTE